jgi:hypothetical protein
VKNRFNSTLKKKRIDEIHGTIEAPTKQALDATQPAALPAQPQKTKREDNDDDAKVPKKKRKRYDDVRKGFIVGDRYGDDDKDYECSGEEGMLTCDSFLMADIQMHRSVFQFQKRTKWVQSVCICFAWLSLALTHSFSRRW